jgi:hypothetical protein
MLNQKYNFQLKPKIEKNISAISKDSHNIDSQKIITESKWIKSEILEKQKETRNQ